MSKLAAVLAALLMAVSVFALDVPQKPASPGTLPEPGNIKEVAPALPDYTKDPFHLLRTQTTTVEGREAWGVISIQMYMTNEVAGPGDQAVYIAIDENGIKRLADWFVFNADLSYSQRRYRFEGGAWVFHQQIR